jgi:hypothetical protein
MYMFPCTFLLSFLGLVSSLVGLLAPTWWFTDVLGSLLRPMRIPDQCSEQAKPETKPLGLGLKRLGLGLT